MNTLYKTLHKVQSFVPSRSVMEVGLTRRGPPTCRQRRDGGRIDDFRLLIVDY
jgi:hypothetical protein